jgi:hypothetical protein
MAEERTLFEQQIDIIKQMPDGADKEQAISQLFQDYEGMEEIIDLELGNAATNMAVEGPEGRMAGDVYVAADPTEHLGRALRQGIGAYEHRKAMDEKRDLSADRTAGLTGMVSGAFKGGVPRGTPQPAVNQLLRQPPMGQTSPATPAPAASPQAGSVPPEQLAEALRRKEEEERLGYRTGGRGY